MEATLYKKDFRSVKNQSLPALLETLKDETYRREVEALRDELQYYSPGSQCPAAGKLPVILFSTVLKKKKGSVEVERYNGIVLLEVNNLSGPAEAELVRKKASESLQTFSAFIGSSGKSLKILVPFIRPDGSLPEEKEQVERFHAQAYRMAVHYYQLQLQCEITYKPPHSQQGCRVSYDPGLFLNPNAVAATLEQPLQMPSDPGFREMKMRETDPLQRMDPGRERSYSVYLLFNVALKNALEAVGTNQDDDDPNALLVRLAENCFRAGLHEEDVIKWSLAHTPFRLSETELRAVVRNVYLLAKNFGSNSGIPPCQNLVMRMEEFMQRRYELRRNELKEEVEYRERRSYYYDFFPMTEEVLNTISLQAQAEGLELWDRDVKRYVYSNKVPSFNPLDDYLDRLPPWDGKDRIRALAVTVPTDTPEWPARFYIWFLGLVAQWKQMNQTYANSVLPLLVGEQGCGKSTWCRNLLPPALREFFTDGVDFGNRRDAELCLHRFALINIDEFDSVGLSRQSFLKHLLQKPEVNMRRPHKQSVRVLKRYGVFVGTCNNPDLLSDPTGSRRFLCVAIKGEINRRRPIEYDQLYAQAMYALRAGERYWFTREEEIATTRNNQEFEQIPVEEQLFLQYFRAATPGDDQAKWLSAIEILQRIQQRSKMKFSNTHMNYFGRLLRRNEIPGRHAMRGNLYHVVEVE